jgi:hypothetical protein
MMMEIINRYKLCGLEFCLRLASPPTSSTSFLKNTIT